MGQIYKPAKVTPVGDTANYDPAASALDRVLNHFKAVDELIVFDEMRVDALDRDPLLEAARPVHQERAADQHADARLEAIGAVGFHQPVRLQAC